MRLIIDLKGEASISMFSLEGVIFMISKGGLIESMISFLIVFHLILILTFASKYVLVAKQLSILSSRQNNSNQIKK